MARSSKKNMAGIICNHKKRGVKKINKNTQLILQVTQLRIIRLRKYPIDPIAYLELWVFNKTLMKVDQIYSYLLKLKLNLPTGPKTLSMVTKINAFTLSKKI